MSICNFTVAVDFGYGDNKGTNWIRCALFGKRAEGKLPQYLVKGTQVAISGELRINEYTDNDGNKRTSVEVNVSTLDLIGGRNESSEPSSRHQQNGSFPSQGGTDKPVDPFASAPDFGEEFPEDSLPF
jgi:single-strand DNA-binding protein